MVVTREGCDCPEFVCDRCGEKILIGQGRVYWRGAADGHRGNVLCYHESCQPASYFSKKSDVSTMPIGDFIGFLCQNSQPAG